MNQSIIHPSAIVEAEVKIGKNVSIWHFCHVRSGAILGDGVSIGKDVYIDKNVSIGKFSRIQNGVSLYQGVYIEDWCFIGPHVTFTNDLRPRSGLKKWNIIPTYLKSGMSIGAGAIIRCGVTLGEFCMIGAGTVVTKDVPPFHLAVGLPAEISKMVCACGQTILPLATPKQELLKNCCAENLQEDCYRSAKEFLGL